MMKSVWTKVGSHLMSSWVEEARDRVRFDEHARHGVNAGTGLMMVAAQEINKAIRHCRIGWMTLKETK